MATKLSDREIQRKNVMLEKQDFVFVGQKKMTEFVEASLDSFETKRNEAATFRGNIPTFLVNANISV